MSYKYFLPIILLLFIVFNCERCYEKVDKAEISHKPNGGGISFDSLRYYGYELEEQYGSVWGISKEGKTFESKDPIRLWDIDDTYFLINTGNHSYKSGSRSFLPTFNTLILYRIRDLKKVYECTIYDKVSWPKFYEGNIYFFKKRVGKNYNVYFDPFKISEVY